jgi:acyl-CoA dehydrogenase
MIKTTAKEVKDGFIINGVKRFITNAPWADVMCVFAKLEGDISLFFVETDRKGSPRSQDGQAGLERHRPL